MDEDGEPKGRAPIDRSKIYVAAAGVGILVALIGVWLTPVSAEIGRREIGASYVAGEVMLFVGGVLALVCVVLTVIDS